MAEEAARRVALLGLPETGKTTYAAAFYVAAERGESGVRITHYSDGDRSYLNMLADRLAACEVVGRTGQQDPGELRLQVSFADGPSQLLIAPDLSGELIETGMEHRSIDTRLAELATGCECALLFVRADKLTEAHGAQEFQAILRCAGVDTSTDGGTTAEPDEWELRLAPTQARLADIVQEVMRLRNSRPLRLALVISAWDQTRGERSPSQWAESELPLLMQLLDHVPGLTVTVFGVSAQGGDFGDASTRQALEDVELSRRGRAYDAGNGDVDITEPIRWALDV